MGSTMKVGAGVREEVVEVEVSSPRKLEGGVGG